MRVVLAQPALKFFQAEVGWGIDNAERRLSAELGDRESCHAVALAFHPILQMSDLHDTLPAMIGVAREKGELVLFEFECTSIQSCSSGRQ